MKSILKWGAVAGAAVVMLFVVTAIVVSQVVDIQKYKPRIEQLVADATGRSFALGDDMDISVFPWVGVKLSDLRLGNPEGFGQADMVSIDVFEVRLKVMPLLSRNIEVKTFVIDTPRIYLEKAADGRANWENIGPEPSGEKTPAQQPAPGSEKSSTALPIEGLSVAEFSIIHGELSYTDTAAGVKKQVSDITLKLGNVRLDQPLDVMFSAVIDDKPVSLDGSIGPVGKEPGRGIVSLDLAVRALNELELKLSGTITDPLEKQVLDLVVDIPRFSPEKLLKALDQPLPVVPKDPDVFKALSLSVKMKGDKSQMVFSDGRLTLDDSNAVFSAAIKAFDRPDLSFDVQLDAMNVDRYLPEATDKKTLQQGTGEPKKDSVKKQEPIDYAPLRKLILDGRFTAGKLTAQGAVMENVVVKLDAKNGILSMNPLSADVYQGDIHSVLNVNVQGKHPKTAMDLKTSGVQVGPLLNDALKKDLLEGALDARISLTMTGDTPDMIKPSLNGSGNLLFSDGAVVGIDLASAVRNVKVKLGLAENPAEKPRTDFAALEMPFSAVNGLVNINGTRLSSPLIRLLASGEINLVKELLDLRVEPKFVATLKGQGDTKDRSGLMVPVQITGSFTDPKVRPDVKGMLTSGEVPDVENLKKELDTTTKDTQKKLESAGEDAKKQIRQMVPKLFD